MAATLSRGRWVTKTSTNSVIYEKRYAERIWTFLMISRNKFGLQTISDFVISYTIGWERLICFSESTGIRVFSGTGQNEQFWSAPNHETLSPWGHSDQASCLIDDKITMSKRNSHGITVRWNSYDIRTDQSDLMFCNPCETKSILDINWTSIVWGSNVIWL